MTANANVGTVGYDLLLANGQHSPDVAGATLDSAAQLSAGTVLVKDSDGKAYPLGTDSVTGEAFAIVAKDMEAEGTSVLVYRSGDFVKQSLITVEDYDLTQTDIDNLQKYGIYLDGAQVD